MRKAKNMPAVIQYLEYNIEDYLPVHSLFIP
jgi:hypothetical protein